MSESHKVDIAGWVERAKDNPATYRQRQAIEIILNAIAMTKPFSEKLYLKGGILMGLAYKSPRLTMDVDLTASIKPSADIDKTFCESLNKTFPRAATLIGYSNLVVLVSSVKKLPSKDDFEKKQFPALKLKIGYAQRNTKQEQALEIGNPANTIEVDISFNEPEPKAIQLLELTGGDNLLAYSIADLIAEKYRAMLQQVVRNRYRRQDAYDIYLLLNDQTIDIDMELKDQILDALLEKSKARNIEPNRDSLNDPEVKKRSGKKWDTLELELGDTVPDFEACFGKAQELYQSLPWDE